MRFFVLVGGDKNDWNMAVCGSELALKLQSIHAGHPYVNDETRGTVQVARVQKHFRRFKSCRAKTKRLDEPCCGPANRLVVVNDRDEISCRSGLVTKLI